MLEGTILLDTHEGERLGFTSENFGRGSFLKRSGDTIQLVYLVPRHPDDDTARKVDELSARIRALKLKPVVRGLFLVQDARDVWHA